MEFDLNALRGVATLLTAVAFLAVCLWVFRPNSKTHYDEAARLPFANSKDTDTDTTASSKD